MKRLPGLVAFVLLALLSACRPAGNTAPVPPAQPGEITQAQPRLPTMKLWLGAHEITAELATTPIQRQTGMMWRTNMAEMEGMLFVFETPHRAGFWMKNTLLPLDVAYIDPSGVLREVHQLQPRVEQPAPAQSENIQFVIEMRQGWFERNGVRPGMEIRTEKGSLFQTFFGR